ncbi:MFS transporter [Candidatus Bipolaricaulota bacterium]|nr:MFS transporter [Candidatus Bipolaricaulota bacterium]
MPEKRWAPRFFTIWVGQRISWLGSRAGGFALVWWLTQETGSAQVLATATLGLILPTVLLGPVAGAYVDRWNRRLILLISDTGIALVSLLLAYLFWSGHMEVWHVYIVIVVRAIGSAFHLPAIGASTTMLVPAKHLTRIAGLNQSMGGALQVAGPVLGAFLISVMPVHSVMLIDVGTAAFALIPLLFLSIPNPPVDASKERESIFASIRIAFRFVLDHRGLLHIMLLASFMNFVINPVFVLLPLLVTTHFGGTALHLGWLQSATGAGLIAGGFVLSVWGGFRRRTMTMYVGGGLQGLALLFLGVTPSGLFPVAVATMIANGFLNALYNGPIAALLQATVPPNMQGRIFTLLGSIVQSVYPISLAILGPVVGVIGIRAWYIGGGILVFAVCTLALFMPSIARLETQLVESADKSAA